MSRFFDDLERDLVRAAAVRARPARRPFAAFTLTAALVLGAAGTAAGATYFALRNSSIAPFAASDVTPEQRVEPGTSRVVDLRAADPEAGAPAWALRVSRSGTGLECSTVGQLEHGTFGLVGLDGVFRALPEANADACGESGTLLGTRIFASERVRDVRTVVNGVAGAGLERVTIAVAGGPPKTIPHSPEGAFLAVLRGYPEDIQPVVTLRLESGKTRRYSFAAGDANLIPDPYGGRAWKLESGGGPSRRPGEKVPRRQITCLTFATARSVPGERNVGATPVCGYAPARPGVRDRTLFFATRRLSGDGPTQAISNGDWNHHPARIAVYGSARGVKTLTVRAPGGFTRTVKPKLNGGFLVFLPPETAIKTVTVQVDGARYGPAHGVVAWRPR